MKAEVYSVVPAIFGYHGTGQLRIGMTHHVFQQPVLLGGQFNFIAAAPLVGNRIKSQICKDYLCAAIPKGIPGARSEICLSA